MRQIEVEEDGLVAELCGGLVEAALAFHIGEDLAFLRNEDAPAGAALEDAVADEVLVGAGDGVGVDDEGFGEDADGGELFADLKSTQGDSLLHLVNNLAKNWHVAGGGDGNSKRHECINELIHSGWQEPFCNNFSKKLKKVPAKEAQPDYLGRSPPPESHHMFGNKQKKKAAWVQSALERYERPLLQYAMSIVGEIERARDVVQETFMRLHNQEQENIEGHLSQWLFTVCRNCALKSLKKEDRYIYVEAQEFETKRCEGLTPLMELERKERVERLMELVKELPKNQYEVVRLRFHHHHSYQEISEITGLSVGNVGFLLNAAMRNLRGKMDRDDKDEKIIYLKKGVA